MGNKKSIVVIWVLEHFFFEATSVDNLKQPLQIFKNLTGHNLLDTLK